MVEHKRKEQLAKYDRFFKRFEHSKALDAVLDVSFHFFRVPLQKQREVDLPLVVYHFDLKFYDLVMCA